MSINLINDWSHSLHQTGLYLRFSGVFLSREANAWGSVHSPGFTSLSTLSLSDRRDCRDIRGKLRIGAGSTVMGQAYGSMNNKSEVYLCEVLKDVMKWYHIIQNSSMNKLTYKTRGISIWMHATNNSNLDYFTSPE